METPVLPTDVMQYRLRTARQKRRALLEDRDKQLIQLSKQRTMLYAARKALPMVPVEVPYQRGWKRSFVLRADVAASRYGAFYGALLQKVNTIQYGPDKDFTRKRRKNRKKLRVPIPQTPREWTEWEWRKPGLLTEAERLCFHREERPWPNGRLTEVRYVLNDPWRYVLRTEPNIITMARMHDPQLEQELDNLNRHIERNYLRHRILRLTNGRKNYWRRYRGNEHKELPLFKNIPLHALTGMCNDLTDNQ